MQHRVAVLWGRLYGTQLSPLDFRLLSEPLLLSPWAARTVVGAGPKSVAQHIIVNLLKALWEFYVFSLNCTALKCTRGGRQCHTSKSVSWIPVFCSAVQIRSRMVGLARGLSLASVTDTCTETSFHALDWYCFPSFCVLPKAVGLLRCISIYGAPRKLVSAIGTSRKMVVYLQTWFKEKYATCSSAQRLGPPIPGSCFWHSS